MEVEDKKITQRTYLIALFMLVIGCAVVFKLTNIQWAHGKYYRELAKKKTVERKIIPSNRGNIYSADGSLLATSVPNYDIHCDPIVPKDEVFNEQVDALADSLAVFYHKPSAYFKSVLKRARARKRHFVLPKKHLTYSEFKRLKTFPLFSNRGVLVDSMYIIRRHPIGKIAERTIGYERYNPSKKDWFGHGIEWSFRKYLHGEDGSVLKQRIAKGQWKPIEDSSEKEPRDGYDIISTIDVYIQDIAHHSLLDQLEKHEAEHGCVVVMETQTGQIKAISNLGRANDGSYYETVNYAITESHEPGSTFKLLDLLALLEDKKADTSTVFETKGGKIMFNGKMIKDAHLAPNQSISLSEAFQRSSNTVMVQAVYQNYKKSPEEFVNRINALGLNKPLGIAFKGEGRPKIPQPGTKGWNAMTLPWMAFGYGVSVTPLQTLTLYNAVANNGEMVRPLFVSEIKEWDRTIKKFPKEVMVPRIASDETLQKLKAVMEKVVKKGTAKSLYSADFSMAGKTGTAKIDYHKSQNEMYYASSFVGFFPADKPKYSCIVIVHKPNPQTGYYGADVAGPVFKKIAQKIFTDTPFHNEIKHINKKIPQQEQSFNGYVARLQKDWKTVPNVKGMPGMDAVALLENLKMKVRVLGFGKVKKQSVLAGSSLRKHQTIILELS
ncbi:MAG: penicillin-binding protein [Flavobacterium sp. BFFFF2]|nr:MAG: penicillin-binding protein [Flavobacterium sp. BFFFF2]